MERSTEVRVAELGVWPAYFKWEWAPADNFSIEKWIKDKEEVHDCDGGGTNRTYWVVIEPTGQRYYKSVHNYGWDNFDDPDERELYNEFEIAEVGADELSDEAKKNLKFVV